MFKDAGLGTMVVALVRGLPAMWRVVRHSWRMKKKWSWKGFERYWDTPLRDLRAEFGIDVFQA